MGVANLIAVDCTATADAGRDALDVMLERVSDVCPHPAEPLEVAAVLA